jgi:hypothetical protein
MDRYGMIVRGGYHTFDQLKRWWQCRCGGSLVLKFREGWVMECAASPEHDADGWFVTQEKMARDEARMMEYQGWYSQVKETRMTFVKDRHTKDGAIKGQPKVRRAGRIALGEKIQGGGAKSLPWFRFVPFDEGLAGEALLQQTLEAIEKFAPGQEDPEKPVVLPVFLPANSIDLIASSKYQLSGKDGRPRCIGDGEIINFKLGDKNKLEVSHSDVSAFSVDIDGTKFSKGQQIPCPGRAQEGRWGHCDKCGLKLSVDLQVAGLPYIWQLSTGDQAFYDQFFTTLALCQGYVAQGAATFLTEVPLLLRREPGVKARPNEREGETYLTWQEMPTVTVEIHPIWMAQQDMARTLGLRPGEEIRQEALPEGETDLDDVFPRDDTTIQESKAVPRGSPLDRLDWDPNASKDPKSADFWPELYKQAVNVLGYSGEADVIKVLKDEYKTGKATQGQPAGVLWSTLKRRITPPPEG